MLAKCFVWHSPSWSANSLWIALTWFLKSLLRAWEGREWLAPLLLFCVIEEWLQHDRLSHLYIFCVIQPSWSCLSIFTTKEYSLRVLPKLELPGTLCSKPSEDLAMIMNLVWHSEGCSLLLLLPAPSFLSGLPASAFILKLKMGTKGLCGLPSVLKGLRYQQCHNSVITPL